MKSKLLLLSLLVFAIVAMTSAEILAQRPVAAPKNPAAVSSGDPQFGYVPPPMDLSHIKAIPGRFMGLASTWDWRALGGVTPVKNQNPYGTCWCFAAIGNLEATVLINESVVNDFSEFNIQSCNPVSQDCNYGGNAWWTTNYLALLGSVDETCDPYPGDCPNSTCNNFACSFGKQVTEWRVIPNDVAAIKAAIMAWGPVYTSMYASFPGFSTYDGSYCMTYVGTENTNHGVLIVGWDDDMCSGAGAWIVKNSWGTGWGDNGFFYIEYENAQIGSNTNVITDYKEFDPNETIYYYDEVGWWTSVGYSDGDDWGMIVLTPANADEYLYAVDFWAVAAPGTYTVKVFDDFNGSSLSNLLAGPIVKSISEEGYYSVKLTTPIPLTMGDDIYLEVEFNNGYAYPIPMDNYTPWETGKTFVSSTGATYTSLGTDGHDMGDVGIRGRVGPEIVAGECSKEGDPGFFFGFYTTANVIRGETYCDEVAATNFSWISTCNAGEDTFCLHYSDDLGWPIVGTTFSHGECFIVGDASYYVSEVCITVPCDAQIGTTNNLCAQMNYCDVNGVCAPDCGDCVDPNTYGGGEQYSLSCSELMVIESPPALYVLQDTLYLVEQGLTAAYIPFSICNGDPCAAPTDYNYYITSTGVVGPAISQSGTIVGVPGGKCLDVYGIINAGAADICDYDILTIIAWDITGTVYDTCVQEIHVVEPVPVPLFSAPVITSLVLAMILTAAIIMRRRMADSG
ncbi:MAG: hypothetical protein JW814_00945 [Candidatus Krumholzibacteriota bacterium]|nr:hypothetical protein [Candidatus Krumholzibacteriota bacterium]